MESRQQTIGDGVRPGAFSHLSIYSLTGLHRSTTGQVLWSMEKENRFPEDQYPSIDNLAAAIKTLPTPSANVPPQDIEFTGPTDRFLVTFVVRQNAQRMTWYWGIDSGERLLPGPENTEEGQGGLDL